MYLFGVSVPSASRARRCRPPNRPPQPSAARSAAAPAPSPRPAPSGGVDPATSKYAQMYWSKERLQNHPAAKTASE